MAAINLDIGGNTRRLDRDIQKTVNRVYNINLKTKGDQPLGRITGQVNQFNKSLDASNARVIAFGASAGIIFGVQRAFSALFQSIFDVQKSLQDINVILNVSAQNLQKFGGELFNIAKNTGQSFQEVAKAATEFSRQGLGVEETLKRTNEALILSRLSGLDAAKSVEALTAAVNSYASQAVTATEVVNKFANVDAAFAVSSADLAEALQRVGSSAAQSGVSLNELIAIVTSAQQTTARGGAVIGNSFKTIFTRLQRGKVVDLLGTLGISDTTASGELKSTIQLLQDLGKVYDTLGARQQAAVAEQVGGVFQINILKAALADLGKEYSIYSSALNVAAGTTDQAIRRNEELNKTYAAQLNALQENARQIASAAGERLLGPSIDRLVGGSNTLLGGINESDGQGVGAVLGKGILDGLGQFIAGPGLALIGGVLLKLFRDLGKFATGSVQQLLGLNTAATQQRDLQASIGQILAKNPQLLELALKGEQGLNQAANSLLASLQKQTVELQRQAAVAAQISKAFLGAGVRVSGGVPVVPTGRAGKAAGYIPNFAQGDFAREELLAASLGAKNPTAQLSKGTIDGKKFIKNNREVEITGFGSNGDSAVIPTYAKGFIPNFAGTSALYPLATGSKIQDYKTLLKEGANYKGPINKPFGALTVQEASQALARSRANKGQISNTQKSGITNLGKTNKISLIYGKKAGVKPVTGSFTDSNKNRYSATFASSGYNAKVEPDETNLEDLLGREVIDFVNRFSSIFGGNSGAAKIGSINQLANAGAFRSIAGTVFETAVTQATGSALIQASRSGGQTAPIDYVSPNPKLRKLFNNIPGAYEAKIGDNPELVNSVADKAYRSGFFKKQGVFPGAKAKNMASGYIPNFAAIQDAVSRERAAGIPSSQIYLAQEQALTSANPMGIGVFNKKDEPTAGKRREQMKRKGFARGFVPNFAIEDPDIAASNLGSSLTALGSQVTAVGFAFQFSKDEYRQALAQFENDNKKAAKGIKKLGIAAQSNALALSIAAPIIGETLKNAFGQESKGGRVAGAAASGLGQVGSFAATGALIAGPGPQALVGAGIGAALGALLTVPDIIKNALTDFPELAREAQKAQQSLTKFGDSSSRLIQAYESYKTVLETGNASAEQLSKVQKSLAEALSSVPQEYRQELADAIGTGDLTGAIARRNEIIANEVTIKAGVANIEKGTGEAKAAGVFSGITNAILTTLAGPLGVINQGIAATNMVTGSNLPTVGSYFFGSSGETLGGEGNVEGLKQIFKSALTGGEELNAENVDKINNIQIDTSSIESLEKSLKATGKFKPEQITSILKQAETNFVVTAKNVQNATNFVKEDFENLVEIELKARAGLTEYNTAMTESRKKIDATISSLNKNIEVQNLFKRAFDTTAESLRSVAADINIARQFTQPAETLETVIGADKTPSRKLRAQSDVAVIQEKQRSAISGFGIDFKDTIRKILQKPFEENFAKISENLNTQNSKVDPENITGSINTITDNLISQSMGEYQNLTSVMKGVENYMGQFVNGQISTQQLLEQSKNELSQVGIDVTKGSQASDAIEKAVAELEVKSIQEQVKAFQQRAKLANETKQSILQSRIEQALGTFGGFEGFMNRPEEEQNYIQKITPDLGKIEKTRGSAAFRYTNEESIEEQEKQAPELGRALTNVYKELIDQSGGAFRDFLQQTIDQGIQQTGAESRDGKAGASARGGFDDIVRGRQQDLEQQLKLAEDQIKVTTDPVLKRDLQGFVDSIRKIPGGTKGIAQLQTQKELGVARQGDFAKLYDKYENEALNRLKDISPELAASLENAISLSDDPLVAEAQLQTQLQGELVGYMAPIQAAILQIANLGGGSVTDTGVSPTQIEAYKPKLTEEQQKKADELRTAQEQTAKKEADIKAKKAQEAALPKDNRTISEIEAATRAKRDQKYLQSPVAPINRATGKKFGSMEEIDAEMNKALALGAINPEQKEYYGVLQNFKKNLDPTATTFGRQYSYNLDEENRPIDPNSPLEIEKRTAAARDQRMRGIINPQQILGPNLSLGPNISTGEGNVQSQIQSQIKPVSDIGRDLRPLSEINNDVTRADYDMDVKRKGLYEGDFGNRVQQKKLAENPLLTLSPQKITTQGPQPIQQSFTQQEAAFSNNTSALTTLAGGIATLNSTISNLNNAPDSPSAAGTQQSVTQPNVTTTTTAPISVIVNPQGGPDIALAIGEEIKSKIPEIVQKVMIAMGYKVPPTLPIKNPKYDAN
jgi:TP901 family phage tail tape measure protein